MTITITPSMFSDAVVVTGHDEGESAFNGMVFQEFVHRTAVADFLKQYPEAKVEDACSCLG